MRLIAEQRYVPKEDGKRWLQCRYYENIYVDASGALGMAQATVSEWEDVPVCEDVWLKAVED